jgi:hypothetical protein
VPRQFGEAGADIASTAIVRSGIAASASTAPPIPGTTPADPAAVLTPPAEPRPGQLPPGAQKQQDARGRPVAADARSSRARSILLLLLLGVSTAWSALGLAMVLARGGSLGLLMDIVTGEAEVLSAFVVVGLIGTLLTVLTALVWFWWFDRVLRNVPALTGQWPDSGRAGAIGWWLVPIIGLVKAPRIVGDVYHRMAVAGTPGLWLLGLWVVTWIGGTVAPWIAQRVLAFLPLPFDVTIGLSDLIALLSQVSYIVAGVTAITLVLAIEHAQHVRRTMGGAAAPAPSDLSEADDRLQQALAAAARDNAAAKVIERGIAPGTTGPLTAPPPAQTGLGLTSAVHPAAAVPGFDADEPLLRPIMRPPVAVKGAAGSQKIVYAADGSASPIPGAVTTDVFTGLPEGDAPGKKRRFRRRGKDAVDAPAAISPTALARRKAAVPRVAVALVIVAVLAATFAGVMLAGPRAQKPDSIDDVVNEVLVNGMPTAEPRPTLPRPPFRTPMPRPTPMPTASPEPWLAAADHLVSTTYDAGWTGRMALEAQLVIGDRDPLAWTLNVARAGGTEWLKRRIVVPLEGAVTTEAVLLDRTVWSRIPGEPWERRDRGFGDQPTDPLLGVKDADDLTHVRTFKQGGQVRHEFAIEGGNDLLALEYLRDVGASGLDRKEATVITDAVGDPVRVELVYAGSARGGKAKLNIEVTFKDVGGDFSIQSPKDGPPVVD